MVTAGLVLLLLLLPFALLFFPVSHFAQQHVPTSCSSVLWKHIRNPYKRNKSLVGRWSFFSPLPRPLSTHITLSTPPTKGCAVNSLVQYLTTRQPACMPVQRSLSHISHTRPSYTHLSARSHNKHISCSESLRVRNKARCILAPVLTGGHSTAQHSSKPTLGPIPRFAHTTTPDRQTPTHIASEGRFEHAHTSHTGARLRDLIAAIASHTYRRANFVRVLGFFSIRRGRNHSCEARYIRTIQARQSRTREKAV